MNDDCMGEVGQLGMEVIVNVCCQALDCQLPV